MSYVAKGPKENMSNNYGLKFLKSWAQIKVQFLKLIRSGICPRGRLLTSTENNSDYLTYYSWLSFTISMIFYNKHDVFSFIFTRTPSSSSVLNSACSAVTTKSFSDMAYCSLSWCLCLVNISLFENSVLLDSKTFCRVLLSPPISRQPALLLWEFPSALPNKSEIKCARVCVCLCVCVCVPSWMHM